MTGTDTGVGKTHIACKLIAAYVAQGYKVIGMKPVAAGCELVDGVWVNEDVLKLEAVSNVQAPRELINPYSFKEAIAPHIAAERAGVDINIEVIQQAFNQSYRYRGYSDCRRCRWFFSATECYALHG